MHLLAADAAGVVHRPVDRLARLGRPSDQRRQPRFARHIGAGRRIESEHPEAGLGERAIHGVRFFAVRLMAFDSVEAILPGGANCIGEPETPEQESEIGGEAHFLAGRELIA